MGRVINFALTPGRSLTNGFLRHVDSKWNISGCFNKCVDENSAWPFGHSTVKHGQLHATVSIRRRLAWRILQLRACGTSFLPAPFRLCNGTRSDCLAGWLAEWVAETRTSNISNDIWTIDWNFSGVSDGTVITIISAWLIQETGQWPPPPSPREVEIALV